jgi:hypothetical protein
MNSMPSPQKKPSLPAATLLMVLYATAGCAEALPSSIESRITLATDCPDGRAAPLRAYVVGLDLSVNLSAEGESFAMRAVVLPLERPFLVRASAPAAGVDSEAWLAATMEAPQLNVQFTCRKVPAFLIFMDRGAWLGVRPSEG